MNDNPYAPPAVPVADPVVDARSDIEVRTAHLSHEAALRAFGWLHCVLGVIWWLGAIGLVVVRIALPSTDELWMVSLAGVSLPFIIFLAVCSVALGGLLMMVGRDLIALKRTSRTSAIVLAVPGLLMFPVGTVHNAVLLYFLLSAKGKQVLTPEYATVRERTADIKPRRVLGVWLLIAFAVVDRAAGAWLGLSPG